MLMAIHPESHHEQQISSCAVNTNWISSRTRRPTRFYLRYNNSWLTATDVKGP